MRRIHKFKTEEINLISIQELFFIGLSVLLIKMVISYPA